MTILNRSIQKNLVTLSCSNYLKKLRRTVTLPDSHQTQWSNEFDSAFNAWAATQQFKTIITKLVK